MYNNPTGCNKIKYKIEHPTYLVNKYEITSSCDLNFRVCFNSSSLQKSSSVIHTLLFFTAFLSNKCFFLRKCNFIVVFTPIIVKTISLSQVIHSIFTGKFTGTFTGTLGTINFTFYITYVLKIL